MAILFITTGPAYAYLDPGSSSALLSTLIALITVGIFVSKKFIYEKMGFFGKKRNSLDKTLHYNIVFYSEGGQYWNVFLPILEELNARGESAIYFSSKEDDPGLSHDFKNIDSQFIGDGHGAYYILNKLKANIVVMTTPGLNILHIKRSKDVKHYCFVTHSAGNCARYKAHGVDYFDSIMVGGTSDKDNLLELEEKRKTPKKEIRIIGCTYLDEMRNKLSKNNYAYHMFPTQRKTILLSPTWGDHGVLSKYGTILLNQLVSLPDYNVIVRPHPQSFTSDKKIIESLAKQFPESDQLKWDKETDGLNAMHHADIMISDFSGIVYDFLFLFQRPVLTFKAQFEKRGRDAMDLDDELLEMTYLDKIGQTLIESDIANLPSIIETNMAAEKDLIKVIDQAEKAFTQNPGDSGRHAADFIQSILKQQTS